MHVSTIVVNYHNYADLRACLLSLQAADPAPDEVIVVDSQSQSEEFQRMKGEFPSVYFHSFVENVGYARGNNEGMRVATGDIFFLLNPDTVVEPHIFQSIAHIFETNPRCAVIQPQVRIFGTDVVNNHGLEVQFLGFAWEKDYRRPVSESSVTPLVAFSGSAVFLRRQAVELVRGFDETYFMYHEDVDLSLRLRRAGYEFFLKKDSVVFHKYEYKENPKRYYLLERNRWFTVLKNYPALALILLAPAAVIFEIGLFLQSIGAGWWREKLAAIRDVLLLLPTMARRRSVVRNFSPNPFFEGIQGGIHFGELRQPLLRFVANPFLQGYWGLVRRWL